MEEGGWRFGLRRCSFGFLGFFFFSDPQNSDSKLAFLVLLCRLVFRVSLFLNFLIYFKNKQYQCRLNKKN